MEKVLHFYYPLLQKLKNIPTNIHCYSHLQYQAYSANSTQHYCRALSRINRHAFVNLYLIDILYPEISLSLKLFTLRDACTFQIRNKHSIQIYRILSTFFLFSVKYEEINYMYIVYLFDVCVYCIYALILMCRYFYQRVEEFYLINILRNT